MKRDKDLVNLRPAINSINAEFSISEHEKFQNEVIRPIPIFQSKPIGSIAGSIKCPIFPRCIKIR